MQPSLFETGARPSVPYSGRTANSRKASQQAGESIRSTVEKKRAAVLACIVSAGALGRTDGEIEHATGIPGNTVRPRRGELLTLGQIIDSGRTRKTASGRAAVVWVAR